MAATTDEVLRQRVAERFEHDLTDAEVNRLIADARARIIARWGPDSDSAAPVTQTFRCGARELYPHRPIDIAEDVTITETEVDGGASVTLAADDYRVTLGGRAVERLSSGTNPRATWADYVELTYVPVNDQAQRDEAIVKLVIVTLTYQGLVKGSGVGDVSSSGVLRPDAYAAEVQSILDGLAPLGGMEFA